MKMSENISVVYKLGIATWLSKSMQESQFYNKIEELDRQMKAAAKQLEFEKAAKLRDQLGELRQQWSDMHSAGESKLKKPRKNSKKQSPKSKKVHI